MPIPRATNRFWSLYILFEQALVPRTSVQTNATKLMQSTKLEHRLLDRTGAGNEIHLSKRIDCHDEGTEAQTSAHIEVLAR